MSDLTFSEYQEISKKTDVFPPEDIINEDVRVYLTEYRTLCTCGEIGELSEKMFKLLLNAVGLSAVGGKLANKAKKIRRDYDIITEEVKEGIKHEVGDILWYLATLCSIVDLDLGEVAQNNIDVLSSRQERGVIQGEGDNR